MTQQRDPNRPRLVVNVEDAQQRIATEIRAEMARQRVTDGEMAQALTLKNQQAFSRRKLGTVPFTAGELLAAAAYLDVPVTQFLGLSVPPFNGPAQSGGNGADNRGTNGRYSRSTSCSAEMHGLAGLHRKSTVTGLPVAA